jgi:CheY-like chemotaxis protein
MNKATILVVDDEPQLRRTMKATLTDLGYSIIETKTGEEALEVLRRDTPDGSGANSNQR